MNLDAIGMITLTTIIGLITTAFWRWVSTISDSSKENSKKIEMISSEVAELRAEIYRDYQSKGEAHIDSQRILQALNKIESDVGRISDKLDRKVDK